METTPITYPGHGGKPPFYAGRPDPSASPGPLPSPVRYALDRPELYEPDEGLVAAVNVALTLRMPLLLTGKPGTGKSELARSLTLSLHGQIESRLFEVTVNSTADKSDLLYRYDELGRLRDAYGGRDPDSEAETTGNADHPTRKAAPKSPRDYLRLRGLGAAIVAAGQPGDTLSPLVPGRPLPDKLTTLAELYGPKPDDPSATDQRLAAFLPQGSSPPVVLLDEIDKAPRELPNDLLIELDRMRFDIPELGVRVSLTDPLRWPVVIITSNAERPLSDAFLRRCVCYEVEVPGRDKLTAIINAKLRALATLDDKNTVAADVVKFTEKLRQSREIPETQQPGTSRILDFAVLIADPRRFGFRALQDVPAPLLRAALTALMPTRTAQAQALKVWETL
jgi:MoxR-like ATPase